MTYKVKIGFSLYGNSEIREKGKFIFRKGLN